MVNVKYSYVVIGESYSGPYRVCFSIFKYASGFGNNADS